MQLTDNVTNGLRSISNGPAVREELLPERAPQYAAIDNDRWKIAQWATTVHRPGVDMANALDFLAVQELREIKLLLKHQNVLLRQLVEQEFDEDEEIT